MASLYTCKNCGAKFAKLDKLRCEICDQYKCPGCKNCYCHYESKSLIPNQDRIQEEEESTNNPLYTFSTIEYAKYLLNTDNLQMKGHLEFIGQRNFLNPKTKKNVLISDFLFYDATGVLPLRVFGPVPINYFPYRFALNKVLLNNVRVRMFKGEFELILSGEIILLKNKNSQSLLKYLNPKSSEKVNA